ncbi:MAG: SAM-dependent methyltransferase [Magnetococcales bacterium]|nr:SAM-dependent methyltransferase [Magnetococcales bacterium]MBF0418811.1 SAM-dependent methyltransferase [Magnetococcales bacterium]
MATEGCTETPAWIAAAIQEMGGVVSGERFMELALYHPVHGYYQKRGASLGREGDFVTAPILTSLFGELLCLQMIEIWEIMGAPAHFVLIEMGPGTGHLAEDIIRTSQKFPRFLEALDYRLVETSPVFREMQQHRLQKTTAPLGCHWYASLQDAAGDGVEGVLFGNEFLDALPVRWLEMTSEGLREVGVVVSRSGTLALTTMPLGSGLDPNYFKRLGLELPVGMRTEVCLRGQEWMRLAGRVLRRGVVLMVDYGYTDRDYYAPERCQGTLVGHYRHQRVDDPVAHPGEMDLTAHVDFSAMARAGCAAGLTVCGYTTQGWFFMGLGLLERLQGVARSQKDGGLGRAIRQSALRLILPEEMGERFKVLALCAGLKNVELSGYRLKNQRDEL